MSEAEAVVAAYRLELALVALVQAVRADFRPFAASGALWSALGIAEHELELLRERREREGE